MDERTLPHLRVAIIHYWLTGMRGGEKVVEALCRIFPQADIYTHVVRPEALSETITSHPIHTTFIQKLPGSVRHYQKYLPLMPLALEQLDLRGYDLVISSESGPAKGVITRADTPHICYCHSLGFLSRLSGIRRSGDASAHAPAVPSAAAVGLCLGATRRSRYRKLAHRGAPGQALVGKGGRRHPSPR
jgi:hypothetical protein